MFLKMAFRNIFRNKRRNVLTLSVMVFGIALAIFYDGIIKGYTFQALELYKNTELGFYKVYQKNYYINRDDAEKTEYLMDEKNILPLLAGKKSSERLNFNGTLTSEELSIPIAFLGVNPENENIVFNRNESVIEGTFLEKENDLVIGAGIAKELNLKISDEVTLVTRTTEKSINAYDMKISGIIKTENSILNKNNVFINLDFAKKILLTQNINDIVIGEKLTAQEIQGFSEYDLISLEDELKDMIDLMIFKAKGATKSMMFVLIMAGVGIANTMLMSMLEREKEIGIMLANGMETRDIRKLFMLEGLILGLIGSLTGFILGFISVLLSSRYGIPLPLNLYENMDINMVIPQRMFAIIDVKTYIIYVLFGIFLAGFASLYAAVKGSKIEPLDVLRD